VPLALRAFHKLVSDCPDKPMRLKIAGGYDLAVSENVEHLLELRKLSSELGISERVEFLCSVSHSQRQDLIQNAVAVLYTPENEHFGIVPCEGMAMRVPVLACKSGGPA
jgi:alpha-1,3/alpha-1,6-mannosyltransferase